jgi:nitrite reductase/ring-hydroxylating ferredoxin subunit/ferredoxin
VISSVEIQGADWAAPIGAIQAVTVGGEPRALIRHAEGWSLVPDACTHATCAFTKNGEVADGTVLICNCHGSEFDLRTGEVLLGPALEPLPTTAVEMGDEGVRLSPTSAETDAGARPTAANATTTLLADLQSCKGYANCVAAADDYLDLDDDGIVVVLQPEVAPADRVRVEASVRSCPVSALRLGTP